MQKSKNDIWVGFFVLLGAAAILFLALQAANLLSLNWNPTYTVHAEFDNIGGLKPRAAVKSSGVVVGRVKSIEFDDNKYLANVTLEINKNSVFPADSSLKILTSGLLGEQYVGVEAGNDTENWKSGDKTNNTQSAVVLENLISQFLFNKANDMGKTAPAPAASSEPATAPAPASAPAPDASKDVPAK